MTTASCGAAPTASPPSTPPATARTAAPRRTEARGLQDRLEKITGGGDFPARLTLATRMGNLEHAGEQQLRRWISRVPDPRLIVIDVFKLVRREGRGGESVYEQDYKAITPLKRLATESGVPICIVHHQRKDGSDHDVLDTISGSTGLTGSVDTIVVLDRKSGDTVLYARGRDIEEVEWSVKFDGVSGRWAYRGPADQVLVSDERRKLIDALQEAGAPMSWSELAAVTEKPGPTVRRLLHDMIAAGQAVRTKRGWYALPDQGAANEANRRTTEGDEGEREGDDEE